MKRAILISVGGSPAPIIHSLNLLQPKYIIYFASRSSRPEIREKIEPALTFRPVDHEILTTPDEEDLVGSYSYLRSELPRVLKLWQLGFADLVGDYTGGTKTMAATVVMTLLKEGCPYTYVGGKVRDKEGLGAVVSGSEESRNLQNPWNELAVDELDTIGLLFNRCRFQPAAELAATTGRKTETLKPMFDGIKAAAEACAFWDGFHYRQALEQLKRADSKLRDVACFAAEEPLRRFRQEVAKSIPYLEAIHAEHDAIVKSTPGSKALPAGSMTGTAIIGDLIANAIRRAEVEHKHDDAVARLYSAIEKTAKVRLKLVHGIDNSNVPPERIPEPLRDELERECANQREGGKIQLPLHKSYLLLAELGDPLGAAYRQREAELNKVLLVRNGSLLAHGFDPVKPETCEKLLAIALEFLGVSREALPHFPTMPWGAAWR